MLRRFGTHLLVTDHDSDIEVRKVTLVIGAGSRPRARKPRAILFTISVQCHARQKGVNLMPLRSWAIRYPHAWTFIH
jgi:hypothetical protein